MITAPQLYALGYGDARHSLARICRWTYFLGVIGFIMLALAAVAAGALLLVGDWVFKLPFMIILITTMTAAVPAYFMITTSRAFRAVPARATLAHFAEPFSELRRLLSWLLAAFLINLAASVLLLIAMAADPNLASLMSGVR